MSATGIGTRTPSTSGTAQVVGWVAAVLLAVAMAMAGGVKLAGDPAMVTMFDDIGAGQWARYLVGGCEVAGAVGVLVPRVRALAAVCLSLLLVGAMVANVLLLGTSPLLPLPYLAMALVVWWLRRDELGATGRTRGGR